MPNFPTFPQATTQPMTQDAFVLTALHYLFSHEGNRVVAHCLDLDIATSEENIEAAEESLNALVRYQIASCTNTGNLSQLTFKAPLECWQALRGAKLLDTVLLEVEVPPVVLPVTRRVSLPVMRSER